MVEVEVPKGDGIGHPRNQRVCQGKGPFDGALVPVRIGKLNHGGVFPVAARGCIICDNSGVPVLDDRVADRLSVITKLDRSLIKGAYASIDHRQLNRLRAGKSAIGG